MSSSRLEDLILEILRLSRRMRREAGRGPSAAELAGYLHLPLAEVRAALARAKDLAAPTPHVAGSGAVVPWGLGEALTAEEERRLGELVEANLRETKERVLASLTPREREVLRRRFGLEVKSDDSLEELGQRFSVTCKRIRDIEAKALRKLKRCRSGHAYAFRPVGADDLPLIRDWLGRPHVACWWSDPDEQIAELRRNPLDRGFDAYVMLLDERPVGYLQCYDASPGAEVTVLMQPPGTRGIDLFIGEARALGQGHGSAFVRRFTGRLLALPGVGRVIADPGVTNARSIRCFEKAGFRRDTRVWRHSEPVVLMICEEQQEGC